MTERSRAHRILAEIVDEAFGHSIVAVIAALRHELGHVPTCVAVVPLDVLARIAELRTRALARRWRVPASTVRRAIVLAAKGRVR